jgi:hypothetical protein
VLTVLPRNDDMIVCRAQPILEHILARSADQVLESALMQGKARQVASTKLRYGRWTAHPRAREICN